MNFIYKRIFSSRAVQEPSLHPLSSSHMKLETSEKRRATSLGWGRQCEENLSKRKLIINGTSDEFEYESIEVFRFIFLLVLGPSRALIGWSGRRRIQLEGFQRSSALPCRKPKDKIVHSAIKVCCSNGFYAAPEATHLGAQTVSWHGTVQCVTSKPALDMILTL
jgi:hypothetical protein